SAPARSWSAIRPSIAPISNCCPHLRASPPAAITSTAACRKWSAGVPPACRPAAGAPEKGSAAKLDHHRDVVGSLLPAAAVLEDLRPRQGADQWLRHPDMVEPPAAVARRPVARSVAPPGVEPLLGRHEMPDRVDK